MGVVTIEGGEFKPRKTSRYEGRINMLKGFRIDCKDVKKKKKIIGSEHYKLYTFHEVILTTFLLN
jgi:hypothetical protein